MKPSLFWQVRDHDRSASDPSGRVCRSSATAITHVIWARFKYYPQDAVLNAPQRWDNFRMRLYIVIYSRDFGQNIGQSIRKRNELVGGGNAGSRDSSVNRSVDGSGRTPFPQSGCTLRGRIFRKWLASSKYTPCDGSKKRKDINSVGCGSPTPPKKPHQILRTTN